RGVKFLDQVYVGQAIEFCYYTARFARGGMLLFPPDKLCKLFSQIDRGDQQSLKFILLRIAREKVEQVRSVRAKLRVGRHQADVGIDPRRHRVVITRCKVNIANE